MSDIATDVVAVATVVLAVATGLMFWANWKLVAATKRLADASHEQLLDSHRPVIYPLGELPLTDEQQLDWNRLGYELTLQNAGSGVALTICGVLFPPRSLQFQGRSQSYTFWREALLLPAAPSRGIQVKLDMIMVNGDVKIGEYPLSAPEQPTPQERMLGGYYNSIARLTLTYQDIFMRKYAGVFDYIDRYGWQCVALLADIPKDLEDLDNEARAPFRERLQLTQTNKGSLS